MAWSVMGIALLAGGANPADADKGGDGKGKGKGNPADIGAIHNIISKIGNQGIGNGNAGRPFQAMLPAGGMPGSWKGGGMPGSSNAGGGGSSIPGIENASLGSKQGKDVKDFQGRDLKEFRTKDVKVQVKDFQDTQVEKDKDLVLTAVPVSDKSSDLGSVNSSDQGSGKSRETAESEAVGSESAAASEAKSVRPARMASCT